MHANRIPWLRGHMLTDGECNIYAAPEGLIFEEDIVAVDVVRAVDYMIERMMEGEDG